MSTEKNWRNIWGLLGTDEEVVEESPPLDAEQSTTLPYDPYFGLGYNPIVTTVFDGEKDIGELGAVDNALPDHIRLRLRSYSLNLKTDIIKIISRKLFKFMLGEGLKINCEPIETVLEMSSITIPKDFSDKIEKLFNLYLSSDYADYKRMNSFHKLANEGALTAFLGGDVLCIIRFDQRYGPNIEVVDGQYVSNPLNDTGKGASNSIYNGVEVNRKGEHVAFWVEVRDDNLGLSHKRVKARNSNGNLVAWLVYGDKDRIDHHRGIPATTAILQKVGVLDRYISAALNKAEQTANVVYTFENDINGTDEDILKQTLGKKKVEKNSYTENQVNLSLLRKSVSGMAFNLPPGTKMASLDSRSETQFDQFVRAVFTFICASLDIPEEVALQKYEQNYSSSRAAINSFEFLLEVGRKDFSDKFHKHFYRAWLEWQILSLNIESVGFLKAKSDGNFMALEAFMNCRFKGRKMPHIDPFKEIKAIREIIGDKTIPLADLEKATEMMGLGDWYENYKKFEKQRALLPEDKSGDDNPDNKKLNDKKDKSDDTSKE